ncbi:hypothetical protein KCU85_g396, partial [Aureobasidium melanogenum]
MDVKGSAGDPDASSSFLCGSDVAGSIVKPREQGSGGQDTTLADQVSEPESESTNTRSSTALCDVTSVQRAAEGERIAERRRSLCDKKLVRKTDLVVPYMRLVGHGDGGARVGRQGSEKLSESRRSQEDEFVCLQTMHIGFHMRGRRQQMFNANDGTRGTSPLAHRSGGWNKSENRRAAVEVAARSGMVEVGRACLVRFKRDSRGFGAFSKGGGRARSFLVCVSLAQSTFSVFILAFPFATSLFSLSIAPVRRFITPLRCGPNSTHALSFFLLLSSVTRCFGQFRHTVTPSGCQVLPVLSNNCILASFLIRLFDPRA